MIYRFIVAILAITLCGCPIIKPTPQFIDITCVPINLVMLENQVQVECAPRAARLEKIMDNNEEVKCFAVPRSEIAFARRLSYLTDIAIASGHAMRFSFKSGDVCETLTELDEADTCGCRIASSFALMGKPQEGGEGCFDF